MISLIKSLRKNALKIWSETYTEWYRRFCCTNKIKKLHDMKFLSKFKRNI